MTDRVELPQFESRLASGNIVDAVREVAKAIDALAKAVSSKHEITVVLKGGASHEQLQLHVNMHTLR